MRAPQGRVPFRHSEKKAAPSTSHPSSSSYFATTWRVVEQGIPLRIGHEHEVVGIVVDVLGAAFEEDRIEAPHQASHLPYVRREVERILDPDPHHPSRDGARREDQFYGDRTGSFEDPFGHVWHIATHKEDLAPEELKRRAAQAMQQGG
jgi:hypothetical protein